MPTYSTLCKSCETVADKRLSFHDYEAVKTGKLPLKCSCGGSVQLEFSPETVSFILKDGESGGWATKAGKENKYRAKRRTVMAQRERDHVRPNKLLPNFQGKPAASWADAKDAAYQSTYDKVKGEHGAKDAAVAASESAKTYDRYVKQEAT